jgi:pyruvate/2-oxoglutarate dehydrogenase complex dihydrolipoamide acyltransferase (E2) component
MAIDYVMPKLAMAMNEGTINEWLVAEGDYVEKGAELASIETEKVAYDVESPEAGYIHIIVLAGETVECEVRVAQFAESEEELASLQQAAAAPAESAAVESASEQPIEQVTATAPRVAGERIKASPLARKMAGQSGLDLATIAGTGPGGRIVKRDVLAARERPAAVAASVTASTATELARIPMKGTPRVAIARRMVESLQSTAQLASSWEADITDLLDVRRRLVSREEQLGTRVSVNALLVKAIVGAIQQVPMANSAIEGDDIVIYKAVHMGIAVSLPGATEYDSTLMVPVLKDVDRMSVVEIDRAMKALIGRARSGELSAEEMSGSTITLSSTAGLAPPGLTTAPILNLPNAMIVGPSTPIERPMVRDGEVRICTMLPLSVTFDHRVMDGEPFARFATALTERLENPELLLA